LAGGITIGYNALYVGKELSAVYDGSETLSFIYEWKNVAGNVVHEGGTFEPNEVGQYTVTVSAFGYAGKTSASVTVINDPSLGELSGNISITPHGAGAFVGNELTAVYSGSESVEYQWKKDGGLVGTDSNRHTPDEPGQYTVTVSSAGKNPKTSTGINIALKPLSGTITITGDLFVGKQLTAAYGGTETISTWQWKRGSSLVGGNSNTYTPDEAGSFTVTVSAAGCEPKTSAAVTVAVPEVGTGPTPFAITFSDKPATVRPTLFVPGGGYTTIGGKEVIGNIPYQTSAGWPKPNDSWYLDVTLPQQDFSGYTKVIVTIGHSLLEEQPIIGHKNYIDAIMQLGIAGTELDWGGTAFTIANDGAYGWINRWYCGTSSKDAYSGPPMKSIEIPFLISQQADGGWPYDGDVSKCAQMRFIFSNLYNIGSTKPGADWNTLGADTFALQKNGLYIESIHFVSPLGNQTLSGTVNITPNSGTISTGTKLTAAYSGAEAVTFQWKKDGANVGTAGTANPNSYTPDEPGVYSVLVSLTGYDSKPSNSVTVTPTSTNAATPTFTTDLATATVNWDLSGSTASRTLTVTAARSDSGTLSYQWYRNTSNTTAGAAPVGTNSASLTIAKADCPTNGDYYYYVIVTNTNNAATGNKTATATSKFAHISVTGNTPGNAYIIGPNMAAELASRNLPKVLAQDGTWSTQRRAEVLDMMLQNVYGVVPPAPLSMSYSGEESNINNFYMHPTPSVDPDQNLMNWFKANGHSFKKIKITCNLSEAGFPGLSAFPEAQGKFEFYVSCYIPAGASPSNKVPAIVAIDFRDSFDTRYTDIQQIVQKGVALFAFRYRHLVNDYNDLATGNNAQFNLAGLDRLYYGDYRLAFEGSKGEVTNVPNSGTSRAGNGPGTMAFWAWGASRVRDYVETQNYVNLNKVAVTGHSRTGSTAMLAAALDERFAYIRAGGGNAALSRGNPKGGNPIPNHANTLYIQWYCKDLLTKGTNPNNLPLDSHFLIACVAPRKVYVSTAIDDEYVHVLSEYLAYITAGEVWSKYQGHTGFIHADRAPVVGDKFHNGDIGYSLRAGGHDFTPLDWTNFLEFFLK
jgi:hypothetical protein